ncbi:MAG: TonB-dependent receptor family protein [Gemmatimonadales bacterium]
MRNGRLAGRPAAEVGVGTRGSYPAVRGGGRAAPHRRNRLLVRLAASVLLLPAIHSPAAAQDSVRVPVLPDIEVRITRAASALRLVPAGATLLEGSALGPGRPAAALEEALRLVPGVYAANPGNPAIDERLSIRGFGARSAFGVRGLQVILDGVPQTLPDGQGQLTDVDLAEAERIEVLRGGTSALYGNAGGGAVAVDTRFGSLHPGGIARLEAGGFGLAKVVADGGAAVGAGAVAAGVSWSEGDNWRDHAAFETRRARMGGAWPVGSQSSLHLSVRWTDQPRTENPGGLTAEEVEDDPTQAAPANAAADARKAVEQWTVAGEWVGRLGAGRQDGATAGEGVQFRLLAFGGARDVENPLAFGTILLDRSRGGVRAEVTAPLRSSWVPVITAGLDAQLARDDRQNLTPAGDDVTLDQVDRTREIGPFAVARITPAAQWTGTVGLRFDHVRFEVDDRLTADGDDSGERTMSMLAPSAGVVWSRHPAFEPYAGIRTSFETPTTTELANRPDGSGGLNPGLEPQTAVHYELGARGSLGSLAYEAAVFQAEVDDQLVPFEDPAVPGRRFFRNAGRSRHRGLELGVTWRASAALSLRGAYTMAGYEYVDYEVDGVRYDGNTIPGVPARYLSLTLGFQPSRAIGAALDQTLSSDIWADDANAARADGWATTDLRAWAELRLGSAGLRPFLSVRNLFDRSYVGSVVVNAAAGRYYEPAAGRWLVLGVEVQ